MEKEMHEDSITVCLADDHAILRHGVEALLTREPGIKVVGEASNGHETLKIVEITRPEILLLDIAMPKLNGIEVSKRIRKNFPKIKIIILSMHDNQEYIYELFSCGIYAYLLKEVLATDLITAIKAVHNGEYYMSPSISKKVIKGYLFMKEGKDSYNPLSKTNLTSKEREILQLIAEGYSSREIAKLINTSAKTVDTHRNNLMKKLEIHRKSELIKYAIKHGIIQINQ